MPTIRRSILLSFAERYLGLAIATTSTLILARILSPAEIGLYSIASAVIALAQVVRDFGVGSYLVQESELTDTRLSAALSITTLLAGALFLLTFAGAGWVADFYAQPQLELAVRVLAFNFLIIPIGSVSMSMLRRDMRYGSLMTISVAAALTGLATVITLAFAGYGLMSLVWASLANTGATAAVAVYLNPRRVWPSLALTEWRRVFAFGSRMTLASILTQVAMSINDLVVGRLMGPTSVAHISRAQGLMNLMHQDLMSAVSNVMFTAAAKARREDSDVAKLEATSVAGLSVIAWPFYGFVALFPTEVLRLLYGPQWDAATPLVPVFCLAGAAAVLWKLSPTIVAAQGRADLILRTELQIQTLRIAMLAGAVVMFRSLMAFAIALATIYIVSIPIWRRCRAQVLGANSQFLPPELRKSIKVTLVALAFPALIAAAQTVGLLPQHSGVAFGVAIALCCLCWLAAAVIMKHTLAQDALFQRLLGYALPWRWR